MLNELSVWLTLPNRKCVAAPPAVSLTTTAAVPTPVPNPLFTLVVPSFAVRRSNVSTLKVLKSSTPVPCLVTPPFPAIPPIVPSKVADEPSPSVKVLNPSATSPFAPLPPLSDPMVSLDDTSSRAPATLAKLTALASPIPPPTATSSVPAEIVVAPL